MSGSITNHPVMSALIFMLISPLIVVFITDTSLDKHVLIEERIVQLNIRKCRILGVVTASSPNRAHTHDSPEEINRSPLILRLFRKRQTTPTVSPADTLAGCEASTELVRGNERPEACR